MLTLILIIAGYAAMFGAFLWALLILSERDENNAGWRIRGLGYLLGCALVFSNPMSLREVVEAHAIGGVWSSHYVMHIPLAADFGAFIARYFTSWHHLSQHTPVGVLIFLGLAYGIAINLTHIPEMKQKRIKFTDYMSEFLIAFGIAFSGFFVLTFLLPYIVATLMFLTDWWWAVLLLIAMGFGGGGTKVYNRDGRHVGTYYD
jgi:hypothetical protein